VSLESALYEYLKSKSSVTALVGLAAAARIFPDMAPKLDPDGKELPKPYIVYQDITSQSSHHVGGAAGIAHTIMQIDCYGSTRVQAKALAEALRLAMDGVRTPAFGNGSEQVNMRGCFLHSSRAEFQEPTDGTEKGVYRVMQEWSMWYVESIPSFT